VVNTAGVRNPIRWGVVDVRCLDLMDRACGSVYLARCEHLYKIGFTQRGAYKRLLGMGTDNPFPVELIREWPGTRADEWLWHRIFWHKRVRGEWFELTDQDVMMIKDQTVTP
jgi:hypothetical protein